MSVRRSAISYDGTMNGGISIPRLLSLQDASAEACAKYLCALPKIKRQTLHDLHNYLEIASPLLPKIARKSHYHFSGPKTLIFIPFLLKRGELIISDQNIVEVTGWLDSFSAAKRKTIIGLEKLIISAPKAENYFRIVPFISKLPDIKRLELNTWTTDDVLAAVGIYCKNLEVLDARGDSETSITDTGLGFLSQCKTLKMILFSNVADEYDYEEKFTFTGKGIALLMLSLSQLERIECPEYILRDALQYIYQFNFQNPALPQKCLFLAYPDVPAQTISILPYLCPQLETLSIYIPSGKEGIFSTTLKNLLNLKKLKLKFEVSCSFDAYTSFGSTMQLAYLIVDAQFLHEGDLYKMNQTFPSLRTLVLNLHSFGFIPSESGYNQTDSFTRVFPHLQYLQFDQRASGRLVRLICLIVKDLKGLYCQNATIYDIENTIENIISNGGWQALEVLVFPEKCLFSGSFLYESLTKLSSLKFVAAKFASNEEEKIFKSLLVNPTVRFQWCRAEDIIKPSHEFSAI